MRNAKCRMLNESDKGTKTMSFHPIAAELTVDTHYINYQKVVRKASPANFLDSKILSQNCSRNNSARGFPCSFPFVDGR